MASKLDIGEMLAQLHGAVQQQPDPDDDSQPTDRQSANTGGPGALAAFSFAIGSDEDRTGQPTLYQSEKDGLTTRPPPDRHAFKEYRRGQFNNNRNFDFSQLPPGAITKDAVQNLVGGALSATQFANAKAFLDTIAFSEGTSVIGFNANKGAGYDVQVGGGIIGDLSWHPGQVILLNRDTGLASSAAGRYQFLGKTWEECAHKLGLKNFQASSQDIAALYLLQHAVDRKTGMSAFDYMMQGNFKAAIHTARGVWASFPGAGYGQHENALERLEQFYRHAGGHMEGDPEIQEAKADPTSDNKLTPTTPQVATAETKPTQQTAAAEQKLKEQDKPAENQSAATDLRIPSEPTGNSYAQLRQSEASDRTEAPNSAFTEIKRRVPETMPTSTQAANTSDIAHNKNYQILTADASKAKPALKEEQIAAKTPSPTAAAKI